MAADLGLLSSMPAPVQVAIPFAALFLIGALLTGVWKWRAMLAAEDGCAPRYVDIAHHAALHYGPSILLAGVLAIFWPFEAAPAWLPVAVMGASMTASLSRYASLGLTDMTNQLHRPSRVSQAGLWFFLVGNALPGLAIAVGALVGVFGMVG